MMLGMRRVFFSALVMVSLVAGTWSVPRFTSAATSTGEPYVPISDEFATAIVMVPKTHEVLFSFKPDKPHVAASLSKLPNALALVSLKPNWAKVITMTNDDEVGGGRLRVKTGSKITLEDALYSTITGSANNTASALARTNGGWKAYLKKMNAEAKKAGATHSSFFDPSGMDPRNMTTARDMALIAEKAFQNAKIRAAASVANYKVALVKPVADHFIKNTNALVTKAPEIDVVGGKTGYLEESLYNLAVQVRPIDENGKIVYGKDLLIVVLGAPTKEGSFDSVRRMAAWAWKTHEF